LGGEFHSYYSVAEGPGDLIAEEADGVGDKRAGNYILVDVDTH